MTSVLHCVSMRLYKTSSNHRTCGNAFGRSWKHSLSTSLYTEIMGRRALTYSCRHYLLKRRKQEDQGFVYWPMCGSSDVLDLEETLALPPAEPPPPAPADDSDALWKQNHSTLTLFLSWFFVCLRTMYVTLLFETNWPILTRFQFTFLPNELSCWVISIYSWNTF